MHKRHDITYLNCFTSVNNFLLSYRKRVMAAVTKILVKKKEKKILINLLNTDKNIPL